MIRFIHWRDDFSLTETFYRDDGSGRTAIPVPEHVEICYFTPVGHGRFVASRNGNVFENCSLSADGYTLTVNLSLRSFPVGHGRLLRIATVITEDPAFPGGLKYTRFPSKLDVVLYDGKSDGPLDIASDIIFNTTILVDWSDITGKPDFGQAAFRDIGTIEAGNGGLVTGGDVFSLFNSYTNYVNEALENLDIEIAGDLTQITHRIEALESLFEEVNLGTDEDPAWAVRLKKKDGTLDRALVTYGDQIVLNGTPGSGGGGGGETPYLHELQDVDITAIAVGQMLAWDGTKWVNVNAPAGTITSVALEQGGSDGTLHLVVNGVAQADIAVKGLDASLTVISSALQSLQSQIDAVASRNNYDELTASALFSDIVASPDAYIDVLHIGGAKVWWDSAKNALRIDKALMTDGDQIVIDGTPGGGGSGGALYLNELLDVTITAPSDGQALLYQNGVWINSSVDFSSYYTKTEIDTIVSRYVLETRLDADEGVISGILQSLQAQLDAVASKDCFDEIVASVISSDMVAAIEAYAERYYLTDGVFFYIETINGTPCVRLNAPFITDGDQIVLNGTPGSGGGSGVTLYSYDQVKAMTADVDLTVPSAWAMHQMYAEIFGGASIVLTSGNYTNYVNTTNFPGLNAVGTVTSVAAGTGLTGGTITGSGTISIDATYLGYIAHGENAYNSLTIVSDALQSLQSQIDSVASRDNFDELTASAVFSDIVSASALYADSLTLGGHSFDGADISEAIAKASTAYQKPSTGIPNTDIENPWVKVGTTQISLGGQQTSLAGLVNVTMSGRLTIGSAEIEWVPGENGSPGYLKVNSAFVTEGDQILISGTPGGGGTAAAYLYELDDVSDSLASPATGDVLQYDGTRWVGVSASTIGGVTSVVGLTGNISTTQIADALTAAGYALTDTIVTSLPWSSITSKPTTLSGYGITDAATSSEMTTVSAVLQSLQSQIDSVSARDAFDELVCTAVFAGTLSASDAFLNHITGDLTGNAATASRLVSASYGVGSANQAVYFSGGLPVACTYAQYASLFAGGAAGRLAYYNTANLVCDYSSTIGSGVNPMYLNAGVPTASSDTAGSALLPVYLNAGTITACTASSMFSTLGSNIVNNLEVTIFGQLRTISDLYATYDGEGEVIGDKFTIIGNALRSLQGQIDSVAARQGFDTLNVTNGYFDMLSVGGAVGGNLHVIGTISTTGDQVVTSDATRKANLRDILISVEQIAGAPAITFDWKAGGHSFGSIAQYWKGVLPESVLGDEGDYGLAYGQLALVNSIVLAKHETEQDREIKRLKERVEFLENKVEQLTMN